MENQIHNLTVRPKRAAQILFAAAAVITVFAFIGKYLVLFPKTIKYSAPTMKYIVDNYFILQFELNVASNIVVYFTAFVLLTLIALFFFIIALYKNSIKDQFRLSWFAFAALFLCLSVYVTAALPEKHVKFYYLSWTDKNGWFEFRWAITFAALLLLAFLFRKFFLHFEGSFKVWLPLSILLYYAGTFGVEFFSGNSAGLNRPDTLNFAIISVIAEIVELGGLIMLLYTLLRYVEIHILPIRFSMRENAPIDGEYAQALNPRRFMRVFLILAFGFGALSFIGQVFRLVPNFYAIKTPFQESLLDIFIYQFSMNTEANIATHFNTLILAIVAALFFVIASLKNSAKDKYRLGWFMLGLFVLYLSIDEQCVLHEKLGKLFSGWSNYNGWLEYRWLIPAIVGVGVLAVLFIPFFFHLDNKFKILFVVAAGMYFAGAFGGEMFSGRWASVHGVKNITYAGMTTIEELLELNGINLLIYSLLHYLEIYFGHVRLIVGEKKS